MTRNVIMIAVGAVVGYWLARTDSSTALAIFIAVVALLIFAVAGSVVRWAVLILMPPWASDSWQFPGDSRVKTWKLKMLARVGHPEAYWYLGEYYEGLGSRTEAFNCFLKGAEKGDADSQCTVGRMYQDGEVAQSIPELKPARAESKRAKSEPMSYWDSSRAAEWFQKAAEQGQLEAMLLLGRLYLSDRDPERAAQWLMKSANHGAVASQLLLAEMFSKGEGVPKDPVSAYMWWNLAAAQGDYEAKQSRDAAEEQMTPSQIAEAQKLSREWKPEQ